MSKLLKIEERINRLVDKCRRLEAELDQSVLNFTTAETNKEIEAEMAELKVELQKKENKLKRISEKMENLQELIKKI